MGKIIWQTEFKEIVDAFEQKHLPDESRGAYIYEYTVANLLAGRHVVLMDKASPRGKKEKSLRYMARLFFDKIDGDVFIKSHSVVVHGKRKPSKINIGILHHIYLTQRYSSLKGRLSLRVLHGRIRALDHVVCVSKVWEAYFKNLGCRDVRTIYNSFDLDEFVFHSGDVEAFLQKHGIQRNKPLIYIGLGYPDKGVLEVYEALKNQDYTLVMTGLPNPNVDIPVKRLLLDRRDYLCLLKASDAVVLMPLIEEGWSRIAHEAMLCGTPVIGSGMGGMKELMEGGKQIICGNYREIPAAIKEAIRQREKYGADGYGYVKRFDASYFQNEWYGFIQEVLQTPAGRR